MGNINDVFDDVGSSLFGDNPREGGRDVHNLHPGTGNPWPHSFYHVPSSSSPDNQIGFLPFLPSSEGYDISPNPWPHTLVDAPIDGSRGFLPFIPASDYVDIPPRNIRSTGVGQVDDDSLSFRPSPTQPLDQNIVISGKDYSGPGDHMGYKRSAGYTPLEYYKTVDQRWSGGDPEYRIRIINNDPLQLRTTKEMSDDNINQELTGDNRTPGFKHSLDDDSTFQGSGDDHVTSDGSNESDIKIKKSGYYITPFDNEDPVYFGFEIELNTETSPLLNGSVEGFLDQFVGYSELGLKKNIITEFKKELMRYFKMSSTLMSYGTDVASADEIFQTGVGINSPQLNAKDKRYYINKLKGLHALNEKNMSEKMSSFVDYRKEKIGVTFYEDTSLNLGTLYSLYKQLYWSRLHGKLLVPENILRFDCKIIISELRNLASVRKAIRKTASGETEDLGGIDVLRSNVSRYVYYLYECQFFFDKPTHGDEVDMGSTPVSTPKYDINFDFKYSNMVFERFNPPGLGEESGKYAHIANDRYDPDGDGIDSDKTRTWLNFSKSVDGDVILQSNVLPNGSVNVGYSNLDGIDGLKAEEKARIASIQDFISIPDISHGGVTNDNSKYLDLVRDSLNPPKGGSVTRASDRFLESIKKAALNEAQRQLNARFTLINNSFNKIRDSFGITSRMSPPTNVYDPRNTGAGNFFFDVQNSLRDFGGDALGGLL